MHDTRQELEKALCQCTVHAQILEGTSMTSGSSTAMLVSLDLRFPLVAGAPTWPPKPKYISAPYTCLYGAAFRLLSNAMQILPQSGVISSPTPMRRCKMVAFAAS